jgi:TetR/AcrR family acrAB operon transcriptional repressor
VDGSGRNVEASSTVNIEREQRILDAAIKLIVHYGYDKTTVSDIAREAGVSKGAVYLHWPSKDDLFTALLLREIQLFAVEWMEMIEQDPEGGTLQGMYLHSLTVMLKRPMLKALMTQDRRILGDFMRRQDRSLLKRRNIMSAEFIRLMQEAGVVRADLDADLAAYLLACLRLGMIYIEEMLDADQIPSLERAVPALTDFIERSLAPEGGGNSEAGKRIIRNMLAALQEQWAQGQIA